ncbi:MAG: glycosyltransferase [Deltaproteobacteria bacterium]|jgi:spore maturation protein CgeB|nr:glycosyltransferase [Deltaproteobacteria bacterium]
MRECSLLPPTQEDGLSDPPPLRPGLELPVLLGSGVGYALADLLDRLEAALGEEYTLAVVDKEEDLLAASGLRQTHAHKKNILWVNAPDAEKALKTLHQWQLGHKGLPFRCLAHPAYQRLDRAYYGEIRRSLEASARINFWEKTRYAKFKGDAPRILLITSGYFLIGELEAACRRLNLDYLLLELPEGETAAGMFMEQLLQAIIHFRPDFALTINHLGVDREGVLLDLLERMELPLASWFVDNPHLILYRYTNVFSPWCVLFSWDEDNIESLRARGFAHAHYLPLGTDHTRFVPQSPAAQQKYACRQWNCRVSFVGNSMLHKVAGRLRNADPPADLRARYPEIAAAFALSQERSVIHFMEQNYPELLPSWHSLDTPERQLSYETLITWEATRRYRLEQVQAILPFEPLIAGDNGWLSLLPNKNWRYHPELSYYADLPHFYPFSQVNFNCTSQQMKGAVNQRVFDVPAAAAFLITDWRAQMEKLFEPGKEVICYRSPEEAADLIAYYLDHPEKKQAIIRAARRRVLAEHGYERRLQAIITAMRALYA